MCKDTPPLEKAILFHGHICPGLLMGVRAAEFASQHLGVNSAVDEELIALVETNSCGVDAIQAILGCTFGKGNLIFKDYGKNVYTIASRKSGRAIRIAQRYRGQRSPESMRYQELSRRFDLTSQEAAEKENVLALLFEQIMTQAFEDIFEWREVELTFPKPASIYSTVQCAYCGEGVMETRARKEKQGWCCPVCEP